MATCAQCLVFVIGISLCGIGGAAPAPSTADERELQMRAPSPGIPDGTQCSAPRRLASGSDAPAPASERDLQMRAPAPPAPPPPGLHYTVYAHGKACGLDERLPNLFPTFGNTPTGILSSRSACEQVCTNSFDCKYYLWKDDPHSGNRYHCDFYRSCNGIHPYADTSNPNLVTIYKKETAPDFGGCAITVTGTGIPEYDGAYRCDPNYAGWNGGHAATGYRNVNRPERTLEGPVQWHGWTWGFSWNYGNYDYFAPSQQSDTCPPTGGWQIGTPSFTGGNGQWPVPTVFATPSGSTPSFRVGATPGYHQSTTEPAFYCGQGKYAPTCTECGDGPNVCQEECSWSSIEGACKEKGPINCGGRHAVSCEECVPGTGMSDAWKAAEGPSYCNADCKWVATDLKCEPHLSMAGGNIQVGYEPRLFTETKGLASHLKTMLNSNAVAIFFVGCVLLAAMAVIVPLAKKRVKAQQALVINHEDAALMDDHK